MSIHGSIYKMLRFDALDALLRNLIYFITWLKYFIWAFGLSCGRSKTLLHLYLTSILALCNSYLGLALSKLLIMQAFGFRINAPQVKKLWCKGLYTHQFQIHVSSMLWNISFSSILYTHQLLLIFNMLAIWIWLISVGW